MTKTYVAVLIISSKKIIVFSNDVVGFTGAKIILVVLGQISVERVNGPGFCHSSMGKELITRGVKYQILLSGGGGGHPVVVGLFGICGIVPYGLGGKGTLVFG